MKSPERLSLEPPARRDGPETSDEAAASACRWAPTVRSRILEHIRQAGSHGVADHEGETALGVRPQSYTPRRGELVALDLVVASSKRRKTPSGIRAVVWVASAFAAAAEADVRAEAAEGGA